MNPYDLSNVTPCQTDQDNIFYPGQLNVDSNGEKIITKDSTPDDYIKSWKETSKKHGVTNILDLGIKYNNPNFTKKELNPHLSNLSALSGSDLGSDPDRTSFFKKAMPLLEEEEIDDTTFNPLLAEPAEEITLKHLLPDLNPWANVGDPRYTLGCAMQQIIQEFYPQILACQEIAEAQGAGIKEDCICSEDGQQIRKASEATLFAAKKITIDPVTGLKKPCLPTAENVKVFFTLKINEAREAHTVSFVRYIKLCFLSNPQWKAEPVTLINPPFFFVKLTKTLTGEEKPIESKYLRYYHDQAERVAELLGVNLIKTESIVATDNLAQLVQELKGVPDVASLLKRSTPNIPAPFLEINALSKIADPIPDYTTMPCPSGVY